MLMLGCSDKMYRVELSQAEPMKVLEFLHVVVSMNSDKDWAVLNTIGLGDSKHNKFQRTLKRLWLHAY